MYHAGVELSRTKSVATALKHLDDQTVEMLLSYRRNCAAHSSPGQLILPESLKLLPLYVTALGKTGGFALNKVPAKGVPIKSPADVLIRSDVRVSELLTLNSMFPSRLIPYVYPRIYQIHKLGNMVGA